MRKADYGYVAVVSGANGCCARLPGLLDAYANTHMTNEPRPFVNEHTRDRWGGLCVFSDKQQARAAAQAAAYVNQYGDAMPAWTFRRWFDLGVVRVKWEDGQVKYEDPARQACVERRAEREMQAYIAEHQAAEERELAEHRAMLDRE